MLQEPKSASGRRTIPLSTSAILSLRAHRERVEADAEQLGATIDPSRLVFSNIVDGTPLKPHTVSQAFRRITQRLGLSVRLHDLRHTHASVLLLAGVHPKAVQERLGHASIAITLDTYSHLLPGVAESAAERFEDAMRDQSEPVEISP